MQSLTVYFFFTEKPKSSSRSPVQHIFIEYSIFGKKKKIIIINLQCITISGYIG